MQWINMYTKNEKAPYLMTYYNAQQSNSARQIMDMWAVHCIKVCTNKINNFTVDWHSFLGNESSCFLSRPCTF
jgi:hypothetical protein